MPPILLLSDAASNLYYGMMYHPFFESSNRIVRCLRDTAENHMTLYELDGATGNERLYNHMLSLGGSTPMIELIKCRNHQTNLVEGSLILTLSPAGHNLLSLFFSFTHFIRTGGHWLRLKDAMRKWVQDTAVIHRVPTCLQSNERRIWQEHSLELRNFLLSTDRLKRSIDKASSKFRGEDETKTCKSNLEKHLDDFFVSQSSKEK